MHEYRKYFPCCDLCYSAACLRDAKDNLVHSITDITRAEGILEFGSTVWFEDICSYLQNPALQALVPHTTKFGVRLVYKLPLKDNALFVQQQNCWSVNLSRQITDNDWMQVLDVVKWVSRSFQARCAEGPTPCWINSVNTHKLFERSQI